MPGLPVYVNNFFCILQLALTSYAKDISWELELRKGGETCATWTNLDTMVMPGEICKPHICAFNFYLLHTYWWAVHFL